MAVAPYYALCTVDEVRAEIGNDAPAVADALQTAVNLASRWAEWKCGRLFRKFDHSSAPLFIREGDELVFGQSIFLLWPIITLTKVEEDGEELVADADYYFKPEGEVFRLSGASLDGIRRQSAADTRTVVEWSRPAGRFGIKLWGVFGYNWTAATDATPPEAIPFSVRRAVRLAAAAFSGENEREALQPTGERLAYIDKRIPKEAHDLLAGLKATHG